MASTKVSQGYIDYSGETSHVGFYAEDLTALTFADFVTKVNAVRTAISAITLCNEKDLTASVVFHSANGVRPTDQHAQREYAIRVFYTSNTTGEKGHLTIPGPDLSKLTLARDEVTLMDGDVMEDVVTALQTNAIHKNGEGITVTSARVVGRND